LLDDLETIEAGHDQVANDQIRLKLRELVVGTPRLRERPELGKPEPVQHILEQA
jgi:hypothetical protein